MKIFNRNEIPEEFFEKIEFEALSDVGKIILDVKKNGDEAVKRYSKQFGDGEIETLEVSGEEIAEAINLLDKETLDAIKFAIKNVKEFSKRQLKTIKNLNANLGGVKIGHRIIPIEKAGCYVPGGNYPLPSSAIMNVVPAKAAGVKEIIVCSPKIQPATIAAAHLSGADKIYKIGGVQAIAAMAYGTQSVSKVDIITGPGNKFVTAAKKYVFGECGIDFLAGPSEVLIIADKTADPKFVAADMLAQCEHDKDARAYLICFDRDFASQVEDAAQEFLKELPTKEIAQSAFEKSFAVVVNTLDEAVEISDKKAPEHLELCVKNASKIKDKFKNYGSLFIGNYSAEVFGDYVSGTNHVLPTNGVARYSGGLSVFNFIKIQTYQEILRPAAHALAKKASILAGREGLSAHKLASDLRKH